MAITSPTSKDIVFEFPRPVHLLGEALAPLAKRTRQALARKVKLSVHEFVVLDDLVRHTGTLHRALTHLSGLPNKFMTDVILKEEAGPLDAGRAAGRLEQVLSEFIDGYLEIQASHANPDCSSFHAARFASVARKPSLRKTTSSELDYVGSPCRGTLGDRRGSLFTQLSALSPQAVTLDKLALKRTDLCFVELAEQLWRGSLQTCLQTIQ